jgi:hypothetical protein
MTLYYTNFNGYAKPKTPLGYFTGKFTATDTGRHLEGSMNFAGDEGPSGDTYNWDANAPAPPDVQKPVVTISSPANGARLSNSVAAVAGKASDNVRVASVQYQLNSNGWDTAQSTNGGTNWTAGLTLLAGSNVFRVYAVDGAGNRSVTNVANYTYVLSDRLRVRATGQGGLSPNYSNAVLEIGKSYSMTATAGAGFAFTNWVVSTNWVGGVSYTNRTLSFLMRSNLTVQVNFVDVTKPTVLVSSPSEGARWSNAVITVWGQAADNAAVRKVEYQFNGGPFCDATTTNCWTNWVASFPAVAGTNVFQAVAIDTSGNRSFPATRKVFYVVPWPLTLLTNGNGRITGATNGQRLEIGRGYTLTASPGAGQLFAGWTGGMVSTNPVLRFLMQSNLMLQANFITNPFIVAKGAYNGLFYRTNTDGVEFETSGFLTFTLTDRGTYSGQIKIGGGTYAFSGELWGDGVGGVKVVRSGKTPLTVILQVDLTNNTDTVQGTVSDSVWVAELSGDRAVYDGISRRAPQAGMNTLSLCCLTNSPAIPGGDGYGTVLVDAAGRLTLSGALADGTPISQTVSLSKHGQWPLYVNLYSGKGSLLGWVTFTNRETSSLEGLVSWIKKAMPGRYYPAGFTNEAWLIGSCYAKPPVGVRVLSLTNGYVLLGGGDLSVPLTNTITLRTNNTVVVTSGTNRLSLTISLSSGTVAGSFLHPVTRATTVLKGVVLPQENTVRGYFLSTNQSGSVFLQGE